MALITQEAYFARVAEAFDLALDVVRAKNTERDELRAALAAAGLPDDQVPTAPVDDTLVEGFFTALATEAREANPDAGGPGEAEVPVEETPEAPVVETPGEGEVSEPVTP